MDVLALTSREDPFPLVMLEAGSHGVPTVCFADSGGGPEFVGMDAGLSSPYLDISMFAANLMRLHHEPHLCKRLGAAASAKVRSKYVVEVQAPKLQKVIERCLAIPASGAVG
jgi:glycosyltransferase involved in cell wall biosynthesis